jgi:hypothetical protein
MAHTVITRHTIFAEQNRIFTEEERALKPPEKISSRKEDR